MCLRTGQLVCVDDCSLLGMPSASQPLARAGFQVVQRNELEASPTPRTVAARQRLLVSHSSSMLVRPRLALPLHTLLLHDSVREQLKTSYLHRCAS